MKNINLLYPLIALLSLQCSSPPPAEEPTIQTVLGALPASEMGTTLIHEHVFLDWSGADSIRPEEWDEEHAFQAILPYLEAAKAKGVNTLLECTPAYLGRYPALLKRLSEASGLQLLTNTGYYGARQNKYIPQHAFDESAEALAGRWIGEWENGIEGTGIRPGFIKIGIDSDTVLSPMHEKLVRAAAKTHLATGLTIVAHTGPEAGAYQEIQILEQEGVAPDAFVWTHAQEGALEAHAELARRGAWISLDGMGWLNDQNGQVDSTALQKYLDMLQNLRENGLLHRTLISHDAGWYTHGEPDGGSFQPFTAIFDTVIPALKKNGFTDEDIRKLLVENPQEAFAIRVRKKM